MEGIKEKITFGIIILLLIFNTHCQAKANAYYNPRAFAMGGAYTGLADDYSAVFYNPAGLAHGGQSGVSFGIAGGGTGAGVLAMAKYSLQSEGQDWRSIFTGYNEDLKNDFSALAALHWGSFGVGVVTEVAGDYRVKDLELYTEKLTGYQVGYGYKILEPFANIDALSLGVNLKYLRGNRLEGVVDDLNRMTGQGFGVDFGLMVKLSDMINMGIKVNNAYTYFMWDNMDAGETLDRTYTVGAGIKVPIVGLTAAVDLSNRPGGEPGSKMSIGLEQTLFLGMLALRAGFFQDGTDNRIFTGGFGVNIGPGRVDFALGTDGYRFQTISGVFGVAIIF